MYDIVMGGAAMFYNNMIESLLFYQLILVVVAGTAKPVGASSRMDAIITEIFVPAMEAFQRVPVANPRAGAVCNHAPSMY
jgi:hypothetical protein